MNYWLRTFAWQSEVVSWSLVAACAVVLIAALVLVNRNRRS